MMPDLILFLEWIVMTDLILFLEWTVLRADIRSANALVFAGFELRAWHAAVDARGWQP